MGKILDYAGAIIAVLAGAYLLQTQAAADSSLIEAFMHGAGAYFVGKGLWMARTVYIAARQEDRLEQLVQLAAQQHAKGTP